LRASRTMIAWSILRDAAKRPLLRMRAISRGGLSAVSVYLTATNGGSDGRTSANATWIIPAASPTATPIRQAIV
jgi:hypothetical protein